MTGKKRTVQAQSVADAFKALLERISPSQAELDQARTRATAIKTCLVKGFSVSDVRLVGSFSKGTAVCRLSDVDLFVCLARDEARWGDRTVDSRTFLRRVRDQLRQRYPTTHIRGDGQAVSLRFTGGAERFDVVPAIFAGIQKEGAVFGIPDSRGGWLSTAPHLQRKRLQEAAVRSGGKLPRVIQIVKWWTRVRAQAVPLNSFHVEMVLTGEELGRGVASYSRLTAEAFRVLARREGRALRDPTGISHLIPAADTDAKRRALTTRLRGAADWAARAVAAEKDGDTAGAVANWNRVFNGKLA